MSVSKCGVWWRGRTLTRFAFANRPLPSRERRSTKKSQANWRELFHGFGGAAGNVGFLHRGQESEQIGDFVERHPTIKILALSFLILIGVLLVAEGLGQHVSKGYVYFAMAFSLIVELVNMRIRKPATPATTTDANVG